jgi:ElaB/YqjD/DUF883 family membrane-anchored ribosome-binding protein
MKVDLTKEEMRFISDNISAVLKSMGYAAVCDEHLSVKKKFEEAARIEDERLEQEAKTSAPKDA